VVLGVMTLSATFVSGLGTGQGRSLWFSALAIAATLVLNLFLYMTAFRVLTDLDLSWGDVIAGAAVGGILWTALQSLGSYYIQHQIKNATEVYGTFALVLGLLGWIYLGAQITLLAASVNVVRKHALWPRSLQQQPPLASADKRAMRRAAKAEERIEQEKVSVGFEGTGSSVRDQRSGAEGLADRTTTEQRGLSAAPSDHEPKERFLPSVGVGAAAVVLGVVLSRVRRFIRHRA